MKRLAITLSIILFMITSITQSQEKIDVENPNDNRLKGHTTNRYQLFPTQNMWTFIKLNTSNGHMWQVQFDVEGSNRFETELNLITLADIDNQINNRFTLYPTDNIYNFILLDQIDGRVWQAQWSMKAENRGIVIIE